MMLKIKQIKNRITIQRFLMRSQIQIPHFKFEGGDLSSLDPFIVATSSGMFAEAQGTQLNPLPPSDAVRKQK